MHLPSQWPSSCSQWVSSLFPIWPGLTYSVWLQGLPVSFSPACNKDVSFFLHAEPEPWTLLTGVVTWLALHGGGLKTDWPWRSGAGKVRWVAGCSRKNRGERGNRQSVLSLCDRICCGKLCNLFKWGSCFQSKAVRLSFRTTLNVWNDNRISISSCTKQGLLSSVKSCGFPVDQVRYLVYLSQGDK